MSSQILCSRTLLLAGLVALSWSLTGCDKPADKQTATGSKTQATANASTKSGTSTEPSVEVPDLVLALAVA